ncbi:ACSS2 isoform 14 [Pongo abelii]|uniref:ACSS2 isoform 14 n=1 Tax=Pongo abelii TaxID=9601 RepID=A0A2J8VJ07_PONAB|nr:ACSS2 isoform 14 [Pongo abelii]
MGLPEERGRSGSGSRGQEEAGAGGRARSWSPPPEVSRSAHVPSLQRYRELHRRSVEEPREFWGDIAKEFYWKTPCPGPFLRYNFDVTKGKIFIEWMKGATTNICYNVLDRNVHEKKLGDKVAFYWCSSSPGQGSCAQSMGTTNALRQPTLRSFLDTMLQEMAARGTRMAITGSLAGLMTCSMYLDTC